MQLCRRFSHFANKNISVFSYTVGIYFTICPLNDLVRLLMHEQLAPDKVCIILIIIDIFLCHFSIKMFVDAIYKALSR